MDAAGAEALRMRLAAVGPAPLRAREAARAAARAAEREARPNPALPLFRWVDAEPTPPLERNG